MKTSRLVGFALLGFSLVTAAQGQLMRVTFDTKHIVGDFLDLDPRDEQGYVIHNPHPVAGTLHFETYIDLAAAGSPGEPRLFNSRLWGDVDDLGHLNDFGPTGLAVTHLPNGTWRAETPDVEYGGPLVAYNAGLTLNPDLSPVGAHVDFRYYGDSEWSLFKGQPGDYVGDTVVSVSVSADEMTAMRVQGPPLTPVPEPATTSSIAALGLCGLIGCRRWLRGRAHMGRTAIFGTP